MRKGRPRKEEVKAQVAFKLAPEVRSKVFQLAKDNGCTATKIIEACLLTTVTLNTYGTQQ